MVRDGVFFWGVALLGCLTIRHAHAHTQATSAVHVNVNVDSVTINQQPVSILAPLQTQPVWVAPDKAVRVQWSISCDTAQTPALAGKCQGLTQSSATISMLAVNPKTTRATSPMTVSGLRQVEIQPRQGLQSDTQYMMRMEIPWHTQGGLSGVVASTYVCVCVCLVFYLFHVMFASQRLHEQDAYSSHNVSYHTYRVLCA